MSSPQTLYLTLTGHFLVPQLEQYDKKAFQDSFSTWSVLRQLFWWNRRTYKHILCKQDVMSQFIVKLHPFYPIFIAFYFLLVYVWMKSSLESPMVWWICMQIRHFEWISHENEFCHDRHFSSDGLWITYRGQNSCQLKSDLGVILVYRNNLL